MNEWEKEERKWLRGKRVIPLFRVVVYGQEVFCPITRNTFNPETPLFTVRVQRLCSCEQHYIEEEVIVEPAGCLPDGCTVFWDGRAAPGGPH